MMGVKFPIRCELCNHPLVWPKSVWETPQALAEIAASADTRPKGGDSTEIEAPLVSGAVPKADAQSPTP